MFHMCVWCSIFVCLVISDLFLFSWGTYHVDDAVSLLSFVDHAANLQVAQLDVLVQVVQAGLDICV
jgi:hypothetical protein